MKTILSVLILTLTAQAHAGFDDVVFGPKYTCEFENGELFTIEVEDTLAPYRDIRVSDKSGKVTYRAGEGGSCLSLNCAPDRNAPLKLSTDSGSLSLEMSAVKMVGDIKGVKFTCEPE